MAKRLKPSNSVEIVEELSDGATPFGQELTESEVLSNKSVNIESMLRDILT